MTQKGNKITFAGKMLPDAATEPSSLVVVAMCNTLALATAVYISASISGGHVNPAVTFGKVVGGHISVPTALFYWIAQMLASVMASVLLKAATAGQVIKCHGHRLHVSYDYDKSWTEDVKCAVISFMCAVESKSYHFS